MPVSVDPSNTQPAGIAAHAKSPGRGGNSVAPTPGDETGGFAASLDGLAEPEHGNGPIPTSSAKPKDAVSIAAAAAPPSSASPSFSSALQLIQAASQDLPSEATGADATQTAAKSGTAGQAGIASVVTAALGEPILVAKPGMSTRTANPVASKPASAAAATAGAAPGTGTVVTTSPDLVQAVDQMQAGDVLSTIVTGVSHGAGGSGKGEAKEGIADKHASKGATEPAASMSPDPNAATASLPLLLQLTASTAASPGPAPSGGTQSGELAGAAQALQAVGRQPLPAAADASGSMVARSASTMGEFAPPTGALAAAATAPASDTDGPTTEVGPASGAAAKPTAAGSTAAPTSLFAQLRNLGSPGQDAAAPTAKAVQTVPAAATQGADAKTEAAASEQPATSTAGNPVPHAPVPSQPAAPAVTGQAQEVAGLQSGATAAEAGRVEPRSAPAATPRAAARQRASDAGDSASSVASTAPGATAPTATNVVAAPVTAGTALRTAFERASRPEDDGTTQSAAAPLDPASGQVFAPTDGVPGAVPGLPHPAGQAASAGSAQGAHTPPQVVSNVTLAAVPVEIGMKSLAGVNHFAIRLAPDDLGNVEVKLQIDEAGRVKAHLTVDRPETLGFLQRDTAQLQQALEQAGLKTQDGGIALSLRNPSADGGAGQNRNQGGGEQQASGQPGNRPDASSSAEPRNTPQPVRILWPRSSGVDLHI